MQQWPEQSQQTQNVAKWVKRGTNELQTSWKMYQTLNIDTKQPDFYFSVFHQSWKRCSSNTVPDPAATTTMLAVLTAPQTRLLSLQPNSSVFVLLAHPFEQLWIPAELEGVDFGAGAPSCPWYCKMSFTVAGFSLGCSRLILTHFLPSEGDGLGLLPELSGDTSEELRLRYDCVMWWSLKSAAV